MNELKKHCKIAFSIMCIIVFFCVIKTHAADKATLPAVVYGNSLKGDTLWFASGYMGDAGAIRVDDSCKDNPKEGDNCMKVTFDKGDGWGGVVWQSPANDWGKQPGGWDLTGAKKLKFWARGEKGGEKVTFQAGILDPKLAYTDSSKIIVGEFILTTEWKEYECNLSGKDLSCIKTGFMWLLGGQGAPVTFYLDEIVYE